MWMLINDLCKSSLRVPGHVIKILHAKNEQKLDELELIYLNNYP